MSTYTKLAEGCCSAVSPCAHQKVSPYTLCDVCQKSTPLKTVTIVIPSGYADAADFLKDCQFEEAPSGVAQAPTVEACRSHGMALPCPICAHFSQGVRVPVAYVNGDELHNLLDDRMATISGKQDGWRKTPLFSGAESAPEPVIEVHGFVQVYNFCFDGGGIYTPTDRDKAMIEDAINCYIAECEQASSLSSTDSNPMHPEQQRIADDLNRRQAVTSTEGK